MNRPEYTVPPEDTVTGPQPTLTLDGAAARGIIDTLNWVAEFFSHHAGPAVHTELRAFAAARGMHPVAGTGAMLDELGPRALSLHQALDTAAGQPHQPAARPGRSR
jgi:hypothetical protein